MTFACLLIYKDFSVTFCYINLSDSFDVAMAKLVAHVEIDNGCTFYYEVMVNKLAEFHNVFKDSFMEYQILEMACNPSTYNFHFNLKSHLNFFKDFLIRHTDFDRNAIVHSVHVYPESSFFCRDCYTEITVGGDEEWE